jgi:hypothetical protein
VRDNGLTITLLVLTAVRKGARPTSAIGQWLNAFSWRDAASEICRSKPLAWRNCGRPISGPR